MNAPKKEPWSCKACGQEFGWITPDNDLILTMPNALLERTLTSTVVHCRCGKVMMWHGRHVVLKHRTFKRYIEQDPRGQAG